MSRSRIQDAGQRLGGARKDQAQRRSPKIARASEPGLLATLWPKPDFREDAVTGRRDLRAAALFMAVYRNLPQRPYGNATLEAYNPWSEAAYRACVAFLREAYEQGSIVDMPTLRAAFTQAETAYDASHGLKRSFYAAGRSGGRTIKHALSLGFAGQFIGDFLTHWGWPDDPRVRDDDAFGVCATSNRQTGERSWRICATNNRNTVEYIDERKFTDRESALEAARDVVTQRLEDRGSGTSRRARQPSRPTIDGEANRVGPTWRRGDVDAEAFRKALRFRGIEFGNWLTQADRQGALNASFDALHDLTDVLGLPPAFASLGGKLGLAFGSRGSGLSGFAAHFEPSSWILHFTRTQGAGALAHEFGHAFDYYLGGQLLPGYQACIASHLYGDRDTWRGRSPPPILNAVGPALIELEHALLGKNYNNTEFRNNGHRLDRGKRHYWGTTTELFARAFEAWIHDKLAEQGRVNDFLCYGVGEDMAKRWNMTHEPYPGGVERQRINAAFDHLMSSAADFWKSRRSQAA